MTLRALIVDDEPLARQELRQLLSRHAGVAVVGEAGDVDGALAEMKRVQPSVVFLDVQLRGETGFDFVGRVEEPSPEIVFVTAFDSFALRAFDCNALDYLLKPVHPERLAETIVRLEGRRHRVPPPAQKGDSVFLKSGKTARFVAWRDILRIESEGNYTSVFLAGDNSLLVHRTLKEWLALAPKELFLQVHRTVLLRREAIGEIRAAPDGRRTIILADGSVVPVGRAYWPHVKDFLGKN